MNNGESRILSSIGVGAMLQFAAPSSGGYVQPVANDGWLLLLLGDQTPDATFTVAMYKFNGAWEAKISLTQPNSGWLAASEAAGLENVLVASESDPPSEFLLTDTGQGLITIQNTFAPPGPYIRAVPWDPTAYLGYGFDDPGNSLFQISVVG
jgi:hypothetical protein